MSLVSRFQWFRLHDFHSDSCIGSKSMLNSTVIQYFSKIISWCLFHKNFSFSQYKWKIWKFHLTDNLLHWKFLKLVVYDGSFYAYPYFYQNYFVLSVRNIKCKISYDEMWYFTKEMWNIFSRTILKFIKVSLLNSSCFQT